MIDDLQVEVVNDIGVILRIQGLSFESARIYEPPPTIPDLSITEHRMTLHLQVHGAKLLGMLIADGLFKLVDSELGRRLQRDKWLTQVMCAVHYGLGSHRDKLNEQLRQIEQSSSAAAGRFANRP